MLLKFINDVECPLSIIIRGQRMKVGKAWNPRYLFNEARVVLHRAGTKRVHPQVDRIIPGRHADEVANYVYLTHFRHARQTIISAELWRNKIVQWSLFHIQ